MCSFSGWPPEHTFVLHCASRSTCPKRVGEPRRGGGDAGAAAAEAVARSGRPEYVQVDQRATRVRPGRPETFRRLR